MSTDNRPIPYSLRLEPEMRARIEELAKQNGRSLNAQFIWMLEYYLAMVDDAVREADNAEFENAVKQIARAVFEEEARQVVREELAKQSK